jgi:hypothetical protein
VLHDRSTLPLTLGIPAAHDRSVRASGPRSGR